MRDESSCGDKQRSWGGDDIEGEKEEVKGIRKGEEKEGEAVGRAQ